MFVPVRPDQDFALAGTVLLIEFKDKYLNELYVEKEIFCFKELRFRSSTSYEWPSFFGLPWFCCIIKVHTNAEIKMSLWHQSCHWRQRNTDCDSSSFWRQSCLHKTVAFHWMKVGFFMPQVIGNRRQCSSDSAASIEHEPSKLFMQFFNIAEILSDWLRPLFYNVTALTVSSVHGLRKHMCKYVQTLTPRNIKTKLQIPHHILHAVP